MEEVADNNNYMVASPMSVNPSHHHYHALPLHYHGHNTATAMPGRLPNTNVQSASNLPPVAEDQAIVGQVLAGSSITMDEIQVDDSPVLDSNASAISDVMLYSSSNTPEPVLQDTLSMYLKQGLSDRHPPYVQTSVYTGYPPGSINYTMPHPTGPGGVSCSMSQPSGLSYTMSHPSSPGNISYPMMPHMMPHNSGIFLMQNELTSSSQSESRYSSPSLQPNVVGISTPTQSIVRTSASNYMFTPNVSTTKTRLSNLNWTNLRKVGSDLHHGISVFASNELKLDFGTERKMLHSSLGCGDVTPVIRHQPLSVSDVVAASLSLSSLQSSSSPSPWQHTVPKRMPWITTLCTSSPPVFSDAALNSQPDSTSCHTKRLKRPSTEPLLDTNHKQRINEEMMAMRMRQLRITPLMNSAEQNTAGMQRWIEVENRLMDEDVEEEDDVEQKTSRRGMTTTTSSGLTLRLSTTINPELLKPSPLLPPDLVKAIVNPTMQVVLWKPPGTFIKAVASDMLNDQSSADSESEEAVAKQVVTTKNLLRSSSSVAQHKDGANCLPDIISSSAVADPPSPINPINVALPDDDWDDDMEL